ncbi:MAG: ATP-dependent DNA helicase RecG, partial [Christensenellales bacterium]
SQIKGVGTKTLSKLNDLGIFSVQDMVDFLPKSYCDMTQSTPIAVLTVGSYALVEGNIVSISKLFRKNRNFNVFSAVLEDDNCKLKLTWFNAPYLRENLVEGERYRVWGKVALDNGKLYMSNPSFESYDKSRLTGVVAVYPLKGKIGQKTYEGMVKQALECCDKSSMLDGLLYPTYATALYNLHFPSTMQDVFIASHRMQKEKLSLEMAAYYLTRDCAARNKASLYSAPFSVLDDYIAKLPYVLSSSQQRALKEIVDDLQGREKTNRMLVGDVGSGKTVVALMSMVFVVKSGFQCAMMAPTEILARQHYGTAIELIDDPDIRIELLTSSTSSSEKRRILAECAEGKIDILIGTHAVIGDKVIFDRLRYVVIDELHKFGVRQKSKLETKALGVDTLVMSATPIPRTLAISVLGDVKISSLESRKTREERAQTYIIGNEKLPKLYGFIRQIVAKGQQCYIVCPAIEDCEGLTVFGAKTLYEQVKDGALAGVRVALLHGKLSQQEKSEIMDDFVAGEIDVLIATTIVEVGVDSPRASCMVVLNSDRFGLAGLHQLRGRVGRRAGLQSYCFLHTSNPDEQERLSIVKDNYDGLTIAEKDAEIRGYGDFFGFNQSGTTAVKVTAKTLQECKDLAQRLISTYPDIADNPRMREIIKRIEQISLA